MTNSIAYVCREKNKKQNKADNVSYCTVFAELQSNNTLIRPHSQSQNKQVRTSRRSKNWKMKELSMALAGASASQRTALVDVEDEEDFEPTNESDPRSYFIIDRAFCGRILKLRREAMDMQYQLACLSTLGGAYHLCNKPETALALAIRQEMVGYRLGSSSIIVRSKVFQAINLSLLGHGNESKVLMKKCRSVVKREGWTDLERFVLASKHWLKMELARRLKDEGVSGRVVELIEESGSGFDDKQPNGKLQVHVGAAIPTTAATADTPVLSLICNKLHTADINS